MVTRAQKLSLFFALAMHVFFGWVAWGNDMWPIASFFSGIPVALILAMSWGSVIACLVTRVRRARLGLVAPLALTFWVLWPSPGGIYAYHSELPTLKVLSWNMEEERGDEEAKFRWIAAQNADIVALQDTEARSRPSLNPRIAKALPGYAFVGSADRGIYVRGRVLKDISRSAAIPHHRREVPMALVETPIGPVQIGTIHLVHGMDPRWILRRQNVWERLNVGQDWRNQQLEVALSGLKQDGTPTILCGDFNMQPFGDQNQRLRARFQDAGRISELHGTWKDTISLFRIDRIWATHDLNVILRESHRRPDSDHHAVITTFQPKN